ncbi:general secretion pathway protein J [Gammaproteobacteria bacterium]
MTYPASFPKRGFTLLELLIAIAIFAVLAAMAYGGLNTVLSSSRYAAIQVERLTRIQTAVTTISRDLVQVVNRSIRDEYGDKQLSFLGGGVARQARVRIYPWR